MRKICVFLVLASAVLAPPFEVSAQTTPVPPPPPSRPSPVEPRGAISAPSSAAAVSTEAIAGRWLTRTFRLDVTRDGHAVAAWRMNVPCDPSITGTCDRAINEWHGLATITFTDFDGTTARGRVNWSTSAGSLAPGAVAFILRPDGGAELWQGDASRILCGPRMSEADRAYWCAA